MRKVTTIAIGCATLGLGIAFESTVHWAWVGTVLLAALFWLTEPWHGQSWAPTAGLLSIAALVVLGVVLGLPNLWLLTSLVWALVAWDLDHFGRYLDEVPDVRNETELVHGHFRHLGGVAGLGWLLGAMALSVKLTFDFIWTLALGTLVVLGLTGMIRYTRQESKEDTDCTDEHR